MLFSSTLFLFAFLPIVLTAYLVLRDVRSRNALLLAASLIFYAWGEGFYVAVLLTSILTNYVFGLWIARRKKSANDRLALTLAIASNLLLLAVFKYSNFAVDNLDGVLSVFGLATLSLPEIPLPIGISFFTFQSLTYVVDIHRHDAEVQEKPSRVALYIALFPQLIAGPIVRYRQIAEQIGERETRLEDLAIGLRRFITGLAKKVLIANTLAAPADDIFAIPLGELETPVAWFGITCFAFQIYFDFAGYSDMAIGLGRCFGFTFPENFNWPYTSRSLREFWRRWHMTLSNFFRDYLYIPMGGNRHGATRTAMNLVTVFLLCGLWHGAAWTFVVWGLVHGFFLALERTGFGRLLSKMPAPIQQTYTLFVVLVAWVFFRADSLGQSLEYLKVLAGLHTATGGPWPLITLANPLIYTALLVALVSIWPVAEGGFSRWTQRMAWPRVSWEALRFAGLCLLGLLCAMSLAAGTHNPFIYFRF